MTWVEDGLDSDEMTVVAALGGIAGVSMAKRDEAATLQIAAMPFLESVEGVDAAAASSLHSLFWASDEENYLMQVLAHPTLEHGISDAEAFVVAALGVVVEDRPDLLETLLDLGPDAVEKRIIQIPLAGEVTLSRPQRQPWRLQHHRHLGTGIARSRSVYGRALSKKLRRAPRRRRHVGRWRRRPHRNHHR